MQRAIDLAQAGLGYVSPNPMVGCVVVHNDRIIGEGFHAEFGGPHAEVMAVNSIDSPELLKESSVYVTLEPCSHHGKTPPCSDLLISMGVRHVVIGMMDPNPLVAGNGITRLRNADIRVDVGICVNECRNLNRRFIVNQEKKRSYVVLKWAQTSDGFIARLDGTSKWISSMESRRLVHKWRSEEDAILIGARTATIDNPTLNVRDWHGKDPVRIVLDRHGVLTGELNVFSDGGKTICLTANVERQNENASWVALGENYSMDDVLQYLLGVGIGSVLVEGGSRVLQAFIDAGLWDEARIFTSRKRFGDGIRAPFMPTSHFQEYFEFNDHLQWYLNK